jgi:hypothetical protein
MYFIQIKLELLIQEGVALIVVELILYVGA